MNDGTVNIFFNAKKYDTMKSEELKSFFKYLCGKEPSSSFTDRLSALVERVKINAQWRHRFMTWEQEMAIQSNEKAKEIAKELVKDMAKEIAQDMAKDIAKNMVQDMAKNIAQEAIAKNSTLTAKKLIEMNLSIENIVKATGLSTKQVLDLKKESEIFQKA
ncbi:hypothetical protein [uncultured Treponema sp.]|uniref:hypothetical protein n=1 Tax=uncultured Treponema sp. TaxID=162155 RepID=UPI0025F9C45D|nr:hypothetical protein [uncultured Treponema sp.]